MTFVSFKLWKILKIKKVGLDNMGRIEKIS